MEKILAWASAGLRTGAVPLALPLASASCTELTLVWHQCNWTETPITSTMRDYAQEWPLLPPSWKYSVPFLILIYQIACPFGQEIAKKLASPEHPFAREAEKADVNLFIYYPSPGQGGERRGGAYV